MPLPPPSFSISRFSSCGLKLVHLGIVLCLLALSSPLAAQVSVLLDLTTTAPNPVPTGQTFEYRIGYSVASTRSNASQLTISAPLPANILFDSFVPTTHVDTVTTRRTAAASALAGSYLARPDAAHLLVVGAGRVAALLPEAYAAVRPIERVTVWARRPETARALAARWRR